MSAVGILDRTAGAKGLGKGLSLTATDEGQEILINENPFIDVARGIPTDPSLKWASASGPLSWKMPGVVEVEEEITKGIEPSDIWHKPCILEMLKQPVGSPVFLARDEALEIARQAFGSNPDLMPGEDFVRQVRSLIGRSILRKLKKTRG